MPDEYIDLHAHTCFSDGSLTPGELINLARQKDLKAVAITDHDTVDGVVDFCASLSNTSCPVEVVGGIELSSKIFGQEVHILGYFINPQNGELAKALAHLKNTRLERNRRVVERLYSLGIHIDMEDLPDSSSRALSRAHIAGILVEKGYSPNFQEAFTNYLSARGGAAYVERERLSYSDSIALIHKAGGVAFLAHLNQIPCKIEELYKICKELKNAGMDGIEAYYSEYDEDWYQTCQILKDQFSFLACGGSDFHGAYKKGLELGNGYGNLRVPYELLERIKLAL